MASVRSPGLKKIEIAFNPGDKSFDLSSADFDAFVNQTLFAADMVTTFGARYFLLVNQILGKDGLGFVIKCMEHHPAVAGIIWGVTGALAAANFAREYITQRNRKTRNSYNIIGEQLELTTLNDEGKDKDEVATSSAVEEKSTDSNLNVRLNQYLNSEKEKDANYYLDKVLQKRDSKMREKYESFKIESAVDSDGKKIQKLVFMKKPPLVEKKQDETKGLEKSSNDQEGSLAEMNMKWYNRYIMKPLLRFKNSYLSNNLITPLVNGTFLSAFTYWILWGNTLSFTGNSDPGMGLSTGVAFGIPFGVGATYFLIKGARFFYNKVWNYKTDAQLEQEKEENDAKKDAVVLLRQAVARKNYREAKRKLLSMMSADELTKYLDYQDAKNARNKADKNADGYQLLVDACEKAKTAYGKYKVPSLISTEMDTEIALLKKNALAKSALVGVNHFVSYWGVVQYIAWVTTDFLTRLNIASTGIPVVNMVLGITLLAWSVIHSALKFADGYYTRQTDAIKASEAVILAQQNQEDTLEESYRNNLKEIARLKEQCRATAAGNSQVFDEQKLPEFADITSPQFYGDKTRSKTLSWSNVKKHAVEGLAFINAITTGAFFARLLTVKGTAVAMPFLAASLGGPATLAVVFGFGILYACVRTYEHILDRREKEAKEKLEQREERIHYLKDQIKLTAQTIQVLKSPLSNLFSSKRSDDVSAAEPTGNVVAFGNKQQPSMFNGQQKAQPVSTDSAAIAPVASKSICAVM